MEEYILQFSIDVKDDGDMNAEQIAEILEQHGITVIGCAWKASWTEDDYNHGKPPIYFD